MIRTEKGKKLVLCDNCEELLGIYNSFEEAKEAIKASTWTTERHTDGSWLNLCPECR